MTPQRTVQAGSRLQVGDAREPQGGERLVQFGLGLSQSEYTVSAASVGSFSEDDARLALIIFAKVQH